MPSFCMGRLEKPHPLAETTTNEEKGWTEQENNGNMVDVAFAENIFVI